MREALYTCSPTHRRVIARGGRTLPFPEELAAWTYIGTGGRELGRGGGGRL